MYWIFFTFFAFLSPASWQQSASTGTTETSYEQPSTSAQEGGGGLPPTFNEGGGGLPPTFNEGGGGLPPTF